jgi:hypothetical protein
MLAAENAKSAEAVTLSVTSRRSTGARERALTEARDSQE